MNPLQTWAVKHLAKWWLANRPFSKEKRDYRKERRRIRKLNRQRKKDGLPPLSEPKKPEVNTMFTFLTQLRTSTVSTVTGLLTYVVLNFVPEGVLSQIEAFFTNAANADGGAVQYVIALVVAWFFARINKTPANPGKI